jgi:hypothetical protein
MSLSPKLLLGIIAFLIWMPWSPANAADTRPPVGSKVSDLTFRDIRGLDRNLSELGQHKAYVFVFTTTACPLVQRSLPKLVELNERLGPQGVQFVAVNVGADDTIREMAEQALDFGADFPFVKDVDLSCATVLGVTKTPEVAILNHEYQLVYRGRIDDQLRLGGSRPEATRNDLEEALQQLLSEQPVTVSETPVDGCEITHPTPASADAQGLEYHRDIAPLVERKCNYCHCPGTAAPFSLQSFADVSANAAMIARVVQDESMPPWYASARHGKFQNDRSLTTKEKSTLIRWINSDRPEGNPPEVQNGQAATTGDDDSDGWGIGKPDVVITMLEEHEVPATGFVPYRYVILPYLFLQDTWVEAFEIRPGNRSVVHHCNMAYANSSGAGDDTFITGYVPGGQPLDLGRFDNGAACFIPKGSGLGLQIHYTTTGKPETCRISVGLRYPRRTVQKRVAHFVLDPKPINIPPFDAAYEMRSSQKLNYDVDLLGMFTHMHVRGRDMTFFAEVPGQPRETLLSIPNYNFEWQLGYELAPGDKKLPKDTVIEAVAHFDNSAFNPYNPDPSKTIHYGPQTVDEMFNGFVFFVDSSEQLNLTVDPKTGREQRK